GRAALQAWSRLLARGRCRRRFSPRDVDIPRFRPRRGDAGPRFRGEPDRISGSAVANLGVAPVTRPHKGSELRELTPDVASAAPGAEPPLGSSPRPVQATQEKEVQETGVLYLEPA